MPYKDRETRLEKQREYSRRWYLKNHAHALKQSARTKQESRARWFEYKSKHPCANCGYSHPAAIDFHHVIKKGKRSVNWLAVKQNNLTAAIREAEEKCIPLCSNCHRVLHWEEQRGIKARRKKK